MKKFIVIIAILWATSASAATLNYTAAQINAKLAGVPTSNQTVITCTGTEATDKAAIDAALSALNTAGGGTMIIVGVCRYDTQLTLPSVDGKMAPIRITGLGADVNGKWAATSATPASALDLRYATGAVGKIVTWATGYLEIDHITLMSNASTSGGNTPFIQTSNTTINIHDCTFKGWSTTPANTNDGIILGGTSTDIDADTDGSAAFQGYGSRITNNFFDQIRTAVLLRTYANGITVKGNVISPTSGYAANAPFMSAPAAGTSVTGNVFQENLIEVGNYAYGFSIAGGQHNMFIGNHCWDSGGMSATVNACHYFNTTTAILNFVIPGYYAMSEMSAALGSNVPGTATGGSTTSLVDSAVDFRKTTGLGILPGMTVQNVTKSSTATITAVTEHTLTLTTLTGATAFESSDSYIIVPGTVTDNTILQYDQSAETRWAQPWTFTRTPIIDSLAGGEAAASGPIIRTSAGDTWNWYVNPSYPAQLFIRNTPAGGSPVDLAYFQNYGSSTYGLFMAGSGNNYIRATGTDFRIYANDNQVLWLGDGLNQGYVSGGNFHTKEFFYVGSTAGMTVTKVVKGSDGNNCNLVFTGGIVTSTTCP